MKSMHTMHTKSLLYDTYRVENMHYNPIKCLLKYIINSNAYHTIPYSIYIYYIYIQKFHRKCRLEHGLMHTVCIDMLMHTIHTFNLSGGFYGN